MDECKHHAEAAATLEEFEKWDAALHEAIADARTNGFIAAVFRLVTKCGRKASGHAEAAQRHGERRLEYEHEHRALVAALRDRDAEQARALCSAHLLLHVRTNMLGTDEPLKSACPAPSRANQNQLQETRMTRASAGDA